MATNITTLFLKASPERVWDLLTKPEWVKQWQYGSDLVTSWEEGSEIRFRTEWDGKVFEQWGRVLDLQPPKLIRYSLFAPRPGMEDVPENYFVMSYVLSEHEGQTRLDFIQEDNRPGARQEAPGSDENPALQALKKLAEG